MAHMGSTVAQQVSTAEAEAHLHPNPVRESTTPSLHSNGWGQGKDRQLATTPCSSTGPVWG